MQLESRNVSENKIENENNSDNSFVSFGPFSPTRRARNFASPENFEAMCYSARTGVFNIQDILKGEERERLAMATNCEKTRKTESLENNRLSDLYKINEIVFNERS